MDIDSFIAKYGPEWKRLDEACARGGPGLAKLSGQEISEILRLYLRVTGHLAEARSRYIDPSLRSYLNSLVTRAHSAIYSGRARTIRGAFRFFGVRYRDAIRRTLPYILVMAALLVVVAAATTSSNAAMARMNGTVRRMASRYRTPKNLRAPLRVRARLE